MVKEKTSKMNSKGEFVKSAYDIAFEQINSNISSSKNFRWLKSDNSYTSHSDLCFIYKGVVFSVVFDFYDEFGKSCLAEDIKNKQMAASKKYNLKACKFPFITTISNGIKPLNGGWNLLDTETNKEIDVKSTKRDKNNTSELIFRYHAMNQVKEYLMSKRSKILSDNILAEDTPNIWYEDKLGNKIFVIISLKGTTDDNKNISKIIEDNKKYIGYNAQISYKVFNDNNSKNGLEMSLDDYIQVNRPEIEIADKCEKIEQENVYNLIIRAISQGNISDKEAIGVFPIPGYRDFLLKIHNVFVNNIKLLSKDLILLPYDFDEKIKNNPHFGIPLYHIDSNESELKDNGSVSPSDIIFVGAEYANISIIKKVSGVGIKSKYDKYLSELNGRVNDHSAAIDMLKMIDIYCKYGIDASEKVLDGLKHGIYIFNEGDIIENSNMYSFIENNDFYSIYELFVDNYIDTLDSLSNLPQKTYDNAIKNIVMPKNFIFDFVIPNNTLIDYEKQEFNFIDFRYEKYKINHTNPLDQIEEFRNVLLGQYNRITRQANQLLFRQSDLDKYVYYRKVITEKIKNATSKISLK